MKELKFYKMKMKRYICTKQVKAAPMTADDAVKEGY